MSDTGLVVLGVVLLIVGIFTSWLCVGIPIAIVGFVVLIYGLVKEDRPAVVYGPPYVPAYAAAPPPTPACGACGMPLQWVPQYGRWFCIRCYAYR